MVLSGQRTGVEPDYYHKVKCEKNMENSSVFLTDWSHLNVSHLAVEGHKTPAGVAESLQRAANQIAVTLVYQCENTY